MTAEPPDTPVAVPAIEPKPFEHSSTAHTRAYIDAEDYREKANGVVAALDI
jgi:hypothetical protein